MASAIPGAQSIPKGSLWRANPCSVIGKVNSQLEVPFSLETLRIRCWGVCSLTQMHSVLPCSWRIVCASDLAFLLKLLILVGLVSVCCKIRAAKGAVTFCDVLCWWPVCVVGFVMPRPPRHTGKTMRLHSASLKAFWPVREGFLASCLLSCTKLVRIALLMMQ